ncbi:MAG: cell division protein ZapA [Syntrophomonadales bacterium]|jgi:cell division protein ZapA
MGSRKKEIVKVTVDIFDEEYVIKGSEESEYIQALAEKVDQKMREVYRKCPHLGVSKLAILTCINLADELSKLQEDYDQLVHLLEEKKRMSSVHDDLGNKRKQSRA